MKLSDLLVAVPESEIAGNPAVEIGALRYDSRRVEPQDVFFAWKGENTDGHRFIAEVRDRGAAAVVLEDPVFAGSRGPVYVRVADARRALASMAAVYHGNPARQFPVTGITGTNGKTTTAFLLKHLLEKAGRKTGLIGTVRYEIGERILPATRTTPEGSDLQELLAQMRAADCRAVVMEVSSHALAQGRVAPIDFRVGVFTNLSQDHLDYHGTMEDYFAAKLLLFKSLDREESLGVAVINVDDAWGRRISGLLPERVKRLTYAQQPENPADVQAEKIRCHTEGTDFVLRMRGGEWPVRLPLLGNFNVANALAAAACAAALGLSPEQIVEALCTAPPVPGRLETFRSADDVTVVVDYAHTEDALRKALQTLRGLGPKRLLVVVGCGGNRDKAKRPLMARAAVELADHAVFTSDNPRNERVADILDDMEAGAAGAKNFIRIEDRREAIAETLAEAKPGDLVCIAGKGHEATQEIAGKFHPFDDRQVAQEFLNRRSR
jgi:UDP-N-acetylmuramoyl-L-alanyl-D-glutamate--2,6-diaminopimelate ligase